ncbi:MAG: long-chain fatty acid transport protein [Gammaproteobacteria bacterium]|jgi:long-chain fatty acid transport protein
MAGSTLASGDDALSQILNPSSLASVSKRLDINVSYVRSNLRFRNSLNDKENGRDFNGYPLSYNNFIIPAVGFAYPLKNTNWTFGFQFYGLGGDAARFVLDDFDAPAGFGKGQKFRGNLALLTFGPAVAYRVSEKLSLGVSLQVTAARLQLDQPFGTFAPPNSLRFRFRFEMPEYGFHYTLASRLSATYKMTDWMSVAVAYQSPRDFNLDGDVSFTFPAGIGINKLESKGTIPLTLPHQLDAGIAFKLNPQLLVDVGYSWVAWSREDPFNTFKVQLKPAAAVFPSTLAAKLRWDDQHIVRLGAAYDLSQALAVSAGYSYASNPVTSGGAFLTFPAYGFHALSVGATYQLTDKWDASLALERSLPISVNTQTSSVDSFHSNSREDHDQYSAQVQFGRSF